MVNKEVDVYELISVIDLTVCNRYGMGFSSFRVYKGKHCFEQLRETSSQNIFLILSLEYYY